MTHADALATLATIDRMLANRIHIWRDIIDMDGRVIKRIYRGSVIARPPSHQGEPPDAAKEMNSQSDPFRPPDIIKGE